MNNNYGLTYGINGHHIGIIIPEILLQVNYDKDKNLFLLNQSGVDLKGNLYPVSAWKELDNKIDMILEKIKQNGITDLNKTIKNYFNGVENEDYRVEENTEDGFELWMGKWCYEYYIEEYPLDIDIRFMDIIS